MNLFSTNALIGVVLELPPTPAHILKQYFPLSQSETSEEIHFDVVKGGRRLAPFVSPLVAGRVMANRGYTTNTFKPAYVKPKFAFLPNRAIKRLPGEPLTGNLSPLQRSQRLVEQDLQEQVDMINRRLEVMGCEVMRTGKVTVSGELYETKVVDFGRDPALTISLQGAMRWGQSGVSVQDDLEDWAQLVLLKSGIFPRVVTMDLLAWRLFKADPAVQKELTMRSNAGQLPLNFDALDIEGAVFMGNFNGFDIWVYSAFYTDEASATQKILPDYTVLMGSPQAKGVKAFGAILDEAAGLQALEVFPKSWVEQDPPVRYIMSQSAPLTVYQNIDASLCATVN